MQLAYKGAPMRRFHRKNLAAKVWAASMICVCTLLFAGCGYTTRGLYPSDIQTVAVPIFENKGLRRGYEFQLTEKVIQKIESETPFKVVRSGDADTTLKGTIANLYKSPFGEDGFDNPRGGAMVLVVGVTWIDNRTGQVLNASQQSFNLQNVETFTIDLAQTEATAMANGIEQVAEHIVTLMQAPW